MEGDMKPLTLKSGEVRALLDTGTAEIVRVMRPHPDRTICGEPYWHIGGFRTVRMSANPLPNPMGAVGEEFWVRERIGRCLYDIGKKARILATEPRQINRKWCWWARVEVVRRDSQLANRLKRIIKPTGNVARTGS